MIDDRRKNDSFLVLRLLALVRRYKMEHDKKASHQMSCSCAICAEAAKLILETNKPKWV